MTAPDALPEADASSPQEHQQQLNLLMGIACVVSGLWCLSGPWRVLGAG